MSENQKDVHGSFVGHLTELRARIIKSFIFFNRDFCDLLHFF